MQLKDFFQKKYIIFYLAILTFVSLLIATLVIGFEFKDTNKVLTLNDIASQIKQLRNNRSPIPKFLSVSFGLMVPGLIFSGSSLIFLFISLFDIEKIGKYQDGIWWIGLILILVAMILILAGEVYYGNEQTKILKPQKFEDIFNIGRFVGLILCIVSLPLTTFILATVWYPTMVKK